MWLAEVFEMTTEPLTGSTNFFDQGEDNEIPNGRQGGIELYWAGILERVKKQSEASTAEKPPRE
jgi:hypothetical protein